jgi:hypothetical protein
MRGSSQEDEETARRELFERSRLVKQEALKIEDHKRQMSSALDKSLDKLE